MLNFQEHFPRIQSPENMIGPMRYISTKKEYAELTESENQKNNMLKRIIGKFALQRSVEVASRESLIWKDHQAIKEEL